MAVDKNFTTLINYVLAFEEYRSNGIFVSSPRKWFDLNTETGGFGKIPKFDFEALHKALTRADSNSSYSSANQQVGTTEKEIITAKVSNDWMAGFERDFRMRQRSRIRSFVISGNKAKGNSNTTKGHLGLSTSKWLTAITDTQKA